jgi:hypothetical protein
MGTKVIKINKKFIALAVVIVVVITGTMTYIQVNNIEPHDTGLFTGVKFSATDNDQVQLADRVKTFFSDPFFRYYDLPYTVEIYGNQDVNLQYWFKERYRVNGTFEDFTHGPFDISFTRWLPEPIIIELNQNNVTVNVL